MARKSKAKKSAPDTIWEIPQGLWECLESILEELYPAKPTGRPRVDLRLVLDAIVYRMRTGCQWNRLPERFGSDSTVHRWFQRFCRDGVFERLWALLAAACDDLAGVDWEWQSADGRLGKARFGGGKGGEKPYGSRQARDQDQPGGRGGGRAAGGRDRGGERPRL
jgi:putative transposase